MKLNPPAFLLIVLSGIPPLHAQTGRTRYDHGEPTVYEQLMLEMINRARANPPAEAARLGIGLNDGLRMGMISKAPKPPLVFNPKLISAARSHTRWMLSSGKFSHTGSGGSDEGKRMTSAGYVFSGSWSRAENISFGGTSGTPDMVAETLARHRDLFKSPGHRKNICNDASCDIGIGILAGRFQQGNAVLATQDFARSGSYTAPMVTGVVFQDRDGDGFYDPDEGIAGVTVVPGDGAWETVTSASGGYAVPYPGNSGILSVTFSGGPVGRPVQRTVERTGGNVKVDFSSGGRGKS